MISSTTEEKKPTKSRRGKGEGSITKRSDGLWMARITIGRDANGKRLVKSFYGRSKKEVGNKLTNEASARLNGTAIDCGGMTLATLLAKWFDESAKPNVSLGSATNYERIKDTYLIPKLGHLKLSAIRPLHVQSMLTSLEAEGVGARTRQYCYGTLHRAFKIAIRWQLMQNNPCHAVDAPRVTKREIQPLTVEQAVKLLDVAKSDRYYAMYVLAVTSGMRQGEMFGLHWESLDLKAGILHVRHSLEEIEGKLRIKAPKTDSGRRQIALSEMAVRALWDHKAKQLAVGLASCPYVFPAMNGGLLRKSNFYRCSWIRIRKALGLATTHFHDLRHSCASLLLADGVNVKIIQSTLGHSDVKMTLGTYAHLMPDSQRESAKSFDRLLG